VSKVAKARRQEKLQAGIQLVDDASTVVVNKAGNDLRGTILKLKCRTGQGRLAGGGGRVVDRGSGLKR